MNAALYISMAFIGAYSLNRFTDVGKYWRKFWISTNSDLLYRAEKNILEFSGIKYQQRLVPVGNTFVNTIVIEPEGESSSGTAIDAQLPPLVMLHGFGGGVGLWLRNLHALPKKQKVIAIDLLGFGRSGRHVLPTKDADDTEQWWVDHFELWRQAMGIDRMHLCGHSLGGYVAAAYGLQHAHRLDGLVLVSPAGVPVPDDDHREKFAQRMQQASWTRRFMYSLFEKAWNNDVTPMNLIKWLGPLGDWLVRKGVKARFAMQASPEGDLVADYIYHAWAAESETNSADVSLYRWFHPFLIPKRPLASRLHQLPPHLDVLALYGSHDWMPSEQLHKLSRSRMPNLQVQTVPDSGHHLYLDNAGAFNQALLDFCHRKLKR